MSATVKRRSYLVKESGGPTPELVEVNDLPPEVDA